MRTHVRILGVAAALAVGAWLLTGPGGAADNDLIWKPVLEESAAKDLIKQQTDLIQKELAEPKKDARAVRKSNTRIKILAVEAAAFAQSAKAQNLAGMRDAALKLAKAAGDSAKPDVIKKLVEDLTSAKPNAGGPSGPVKWKDYLDDQDEVMTPFKTLPKGGDGLPPSLQSNARLKGTLNGVEEKIRELAKRALRPNLVAKEAPDIALMADKVAVLAQLNYEFAPEKDEGMKKVKDWKEWSVEMRQTALELAEAARKADAQKIFAASQKVNSNCNKCHGIFKPE